MSIGEWTNKYRKGEFVFMETHNNFNSSRFSVENLSKAIYVVNNHAKTATEPKFLNELKKRTLLKLIDQGKAEKIGLHFCRNPKSSKQASTVLISCGDYLFHLPPTKEDLRTLPYFGELNDQQRNPKVRLSLKQAKYLLIPYTGLKEPQPQNPYVLQPSKRFLRTYVKSYRERDL